MKTHFSPHLQSDDAEQAACGTWLGEASGMTGDWSRVDCRLCLKLKVKITEQGQTEERAIVEQMGDMAEFMKRQEQPPMTINREQIKQVFLAHGFTIKPGQDDLKEYVYAATEELTANLEAEIVKRDAQIAELKQQFLSLASLTASTPLVIEQQRGAVVPPNADDHAAFESFMETNGAVNDRRELQYMLWRAGRNPSPPCEEDAARLDFILQGFRKVVVESLPGNRKEIYVEEGFMGDKQYPPVTHDGEWVSGSSIDLELKRKAIDAALASCKEGE